MEVGGRGRGTKGIPKAKCSSHERYSSIHWCKISKEIAQYCYYYFYYTYFQIIMYKWIKSSIPLLFSPLSVLFLENFPRKNELLRNWWLTDRPTPRALLKPETILERGYSACSKKCPRENPTQTRDEYFTTFISSHPDPQDPKMSPTQYCTLWWTW